MLNSAKDSKDLTSDNRDKIWFAALQEGNFEAYREIFNHYSPMLVRLAGVSVDIDSAEEIVQEVLLKLWLRRNSLDIKTGLAAYLFGSVKNRTANMIRHEKVVRLKEHISYDSARQWMGASPISPDLQLIAEERLNLLREALESLSILQREVITLRLEEQLSYDQIAEILSISVSAAKQHGSRAQREIRRALEKRMAE